MTELYTISIPAGKSGHWVEVELAHNWPDVSTIMFLSEIDKWILQHDLGRRQSYTMWRMNNADAVTAFILKWAQ